MHSNVKNDFLIPDLNRNYFSNDTYKFLFPEALSEDFIHSIEGLESQSIPTSKDDKSIKEEKKNFENKEFIYSKNNKINKTDKKIDKFHKKVFETQCNSSSSENKYTNISNDDKDDILESNKLEKQSIGLLIPESSNENKKNFEGDCLLNYNNAPTKNSKRSLNQNKNENKFLTKKRSSSKNDIPIEQVKPNKSRFKENIIKGDKDIKQVILKCLECFIGFINIICNSKYNIQFQFSSINFEEMIPKDDESFQNFLDKKVEDIYLGVLRINPEENLINKKELDSVIEMEQNNPNIKYKLLNDLFSMKIKEIILIYVDSNPKIIYYHQLYLIMETLKINYEYNNKKKKIIREEIYKLLGNKSPIFNDDILGKNGGNEYKSAIINYNIDNKINLIKKFLDIQEENKPDINNNKYFFLFIKYLKKESNEVVNNSKRPEYIRKKFIKKAIIRFENCINILFELYYKNNNFEINEIAIKGKIKNVKLQQKFLDKEMISIYKICFPNGCKKYNIKSIIKRLELEKKCKKEKKKSKYQ